MLCILDNFFRVNNCQFADNQQCKKWKWKTLFFYSLITFSVWSNITNDMALLGCYKSATCTFGTASKRTGRKYPKMCTIAIPVSCV